MLRDHIHREPNQQNQRWRDCYQQARQSAARCTAVIVLCGNTRARHYWVP
jgi:hypothetical protein